MAVGQSILTVKGSYALVDAVKLNRSVKPKFYKVSNQDLPLDPTLTDISGVWKQADISGYFPVNDNTVEFLIDIPPEQAVDYGKTFGLYLEDGTLFMIAKPPYPFPPSLRQTFKIQLVFDNANSLIDFQYIPFYETEQDLTLLDVSATLSERIQKLRKDIELLELARRQLFKNDIEARKDIENFKTLFQQTIERIDKELSNIYSEIEVLTTNQQAILESLYALTSIVQKNTEEIERIIRKNKIYGGS